MGSAYHAGSGAKPETSRGGAPRRLGAGRGSRRAGARPRPAVRARPAPSDGLPRPCRTLFKPLPGMNAKPTVAAAGFALLVRPSPWPTDSTLASPVSAKLQRERRFRVMGVKRNGARPPMGPVHFGFAQLGQRSARTAHTHWFRGTGDLQTPGRHPDPKCFGIRARDAVDDLLRALGDHQGERVSEAVQDSAEGKLGVRLHAVLQQLQRQLGAVRRLLLCSRSERLGSAVVQERGRAECGPGATL